MIRSVSQSLSGWGRYPAQPCVVFRPEKSRDNSAILQQWNAPDFAVPDFIARGLGRSYGDSAINENSAVVLQQRLNRMLAFDEATGVLECEAGVSFAEIIEVFLPRGYFLPVTPGTKFVTVGGAIAADVHGKNHHRDGNISVFVLDFQLLTGRGEIISCSREENAEAFWATTGGMGLTGIIVSARLQLRKVLSAYFSVDYEQAPNLDAALEGFDSDDNYQYSVAWIDCLSSGASLGRSVLIRGNHAPPDALPVENRATPYTLKARPHASVPLDFPSCTLNPLSIKAFNELYYRAHPTRSGVITNYDSFFYPLDAVENWNRMYGKRGFVQYQAVFPAHTSRAGLVELLEKIAAAQRSSFLAVLKTFGEANDGLLSFPRRGHTLALDLPFTGADLVTFLHELDEIVLRHEGRVYLAKDAVMRPETFAAMYPNLPRFQEIKSRLDPAEKFASSQSKRLGITPDGASPDGKSNGGRA